MIQLKAPRPKIIIAEQHHCPKTRKRGSMTSPMMRRALANWPLNGEVVWSNKKIYPLIKTFSSAPLAFDLTSDWKLCDSLPASALYRFLARSTDWQIVCTKRKEMKIQKRKISAERFILSFQNILHIVSSNQSLNLFRKTIKMS